MKTNEMDEMKYLVFFQNWYELAEGRDTDAKRLAFYDAIFHYAFEGDVPEKPQKGDPAEKWAAYDAYSIVYPLIDKAKMKAQAGRKGGRPKKQTESRNESKPKAEVKADGVADEKHSNNNKNKNMNKNMNENKNENEREACQGTPAPAPEQVSDSVVENGRFGDPPRLTTNS